MRRLTPFLLLAVLTLGTGLGIGLGLHEAPGSHTNTPRAAVGFSKATTTTVPPTSATTTTLPGTGPIPDCKTLPGGTADFRVQLANEAAETFVEQRTESPFLCFTLSVPNPSDYPELMQCDGETGREGTIAALTLSSGQMVDLTTMNDYTLRQFGEPCYTFPQ